LVTHTEGRTKIKDTSGKGVKENIWTYEGGNGRRLQKTAK
jgi:hypothetical protein